MSVSAIQNSNVINASEQKSPKDEALRKAAVQFEAVLLTQLTSVLNNSSGDKDKLFGSDGGTDLAKKLFSEQLATVMAENGGIGLVETMMSQFGSNKTPAANSKTPTLANAMSAIKEIKNQSLKPLNASREIDVSKLIDKTGKINPILDKFGKANPNEAEIISTYSNGNEKISDNESWRKPFLDKSKGIDYTDPNNQVNKTSSEITVAKTANTNASKNVEFQIPVKGRISSSFGSRFHPIDKRVKFHTGLDIAARRGTPIAASADGVVTYSGKRGGYGNMVIIEHADGKISRYAHADKLVVKKGQEVTAGQKIATVGSTGKATGPHLHFEIREGNSPIDPKKVFSNVLLK